MRTQYPYWARDRTRASTGADFWDLSDSLAFLSHCLGIQRPDTLPETPRHRWQQNVKPGPWHASSKITRHCHAGSEDDHTGKIYVCYETSKSKHWSADRSNSPLLDKT